MPQRIDKKSVDTLVDRIVCQTARAFEAACRGNNDMDNVSLRSLLKTSLRTSLLDFHNTLLSLSLGKDQTVDENDPATLRRIVTESARNTKPPAAACHESAMRPRLNAPEDDILVPKDYFDFMGLPQELRLEVYELLLSGEPDDDIEIIFMGNWLNTTGNDAYVNILRVSRQVYDEAIPLLYKNRELCAYVDYFASEAYGLCGLIGD